MEFDSGMARADAELAALALLVGGVAINLRGCA